MSGKRKVCTRFPDAHRRCVDSSHSARSLRRFPAQSWILTAMQGLLVPRDDEWKSWAYRMKSQVLHHSGGRCVRVSVTQQALRRFFTQEVGLCHSGSAMCRSSGLCIQVPVATLVLRQSPLLELGCVVLGRRCGDSFTARQAVCRFRQAVHRSSPDKEFL
ncbi:hypothetical protein NDU88_004488 [Pleurodeles waltl]|uniref:Uncharacterized protein n=1 Tax=Pleurodeles waltl TaxID=8319 RepID=A0AAV7M784_PLEWA|nr:hypothetical protein NDU88_004488 [Pleurodeles waltl]